MKNQLNKLTTRQIQSAKAEKSIKLFDGGGLFLLIQQGRKYWRLKYRYGNKERSLALGVYPEVSLADARIQRDKARDLISKGIDPNSHRRAQRYEQIISTNNTFKAISVEWHDSVHTHSVIADHASKNLRRIELYLYPKLAHRPINEITSRELLEVIRDIEKRGIVETANRTLGLCKQIWTYALRTGRVDRNIATELTGTIQPAKEKHLPSIIDPKEVAPLLRAIDSYQGHTSAMSALKLAPLLFVRPNELRFAEWKDFDLDAGVWDFKPSKGGLPFKFPLSTQAIEILKEQYNVSGHIKYVFPSIRTWSKPISNNTLNSALNTLGYKDKITPHGFRAMARTILAEHLNFPAEIIEQQLGHIVKDSNGRAYNRTTFFEQRKKMMQAWGDYLDGLKDGVDNVVSLNRMSA
jgi:integrase